MDLAPSVLLYYVYSLLLAIGFIGTPMLIFYFQKKDLKYEFRHRIIPNETLYRNKFGGFRLFDIGSGILIGFGFYFIGGIIYNVTRNFIIFWLGADFFTIAQQGAVNTVPPPPPPNNLIIWLVIMSGIGVNILIIGVSEEFLYRGVIMKELNHSSKFLGIFGSSFVFMLYHVLPGIVPWQTTLTFSLYYFIFGLMLAIVSLIQKLDLVTAIVAHGTFNSILWVIDYIPYLT